MEQQPPYRREAGGGVTSGRPRIRGRTNMSPPRASSPSSIMMSISTVHGPFPNSNNNQSASSSTSSLSPEGSPRSTASNSSMGGGRSYPGVGISGGRRPPPPVVSPTSPNSYNNSDNYHSFPFTVNEHNKSGSSSAGSNSTSPRPRMTVSELETVSSAASGSALPPSQQPHHPSYSFRRVRSLPAASSSAQAASTTPHRGGGAAGRAVSHNTPTFHNSSFFSEPNEVAVSSGISSSFSMDQQQTPSFLESGVMKLVHAVQQNGPRPFGLTLEEKALWDAIQVCKRQARKEALDQEAAERQQQQQQQEQPTSWSTDPDSTWESRFLQIQEQAKLQQRDNSRSLQAIQRVLADVQAQRDEAVLQLQDYLTVPAGGGADSCTSCSSDPERESMQRDLQAMSRRIVMLEKGLRRTPSPSNSGGPLVPLVDTANNTSATNSPATANTTDLEDDDDDEHDEDDHEPSTGVDDPVLPSLEVDRLELENKALQQELEWRENEIRNLKSELAESQDARGLEAIRLELQDKASALENAKMIIASLENASGSLASDLRAKMKLRDEENARLQTEAAQLKRTADRLATELRTAQKKAQQEQPSTVSKKRAAEAEQVKRLQLSSRLETNMAEIFAASVVLESTQDPGALAKLSELLTDSIGTLKEGIDVIENGCSGDERLPARLWKELEEKRKTVKRLEEKLETRDEEMARIREKAEAAERQREAEVQHLHAEIKILRQQCDTNMEVLTRKERELTVLRDSLMVGDDAAVGYISDDEDDDEDPNDNNNYNSDKHALSGPISPVPAEYGPTQAEALATLLAAGGNRSFDSAIATNEEQLTRNLQTVMAELTKTRTDYDKSKRELKVQKESLSNAKMIISSLERANKSMMEDLRARLQDSNTAIASLLEKSLESEKTCATLRAELESMKRAASRRRHEEEEEEETALALPPTPLPLLLTETID